MEKRVYKRINFGMKTKVNNEQGMLVDLSRSGVRLSTSGVLTSDTVAIDLLAGSQTFSLSGVVQWEKKNKSNLREVGVSIKNAPFEYYQFLNELIDHTEFKSSALLWVIVFVMFLAGIFIVF